jgi:ribosomal protein S27E
MVMTMTKQEKQLKEQFDILIKDHKHKDTLMFNAKINNLTKDITNQTFNSLYVHMYLGSSGEHSVWLVECTECNNFQILYSYSIINRVKQKRPKCDKCKSITHGESRTRFYRQWSRMVSKCTNENNNAYKYFGELGFRVDDHWLEYKNFKEDMFDSYVDGATLKLKGSANVFDKDNTEWII